jgi:hypothetical protein
MPDKYEVMTEELAKEMLDSAWTMIYRRNEVTGATAILSKAHKAVGTYATVVVVDGVIRYALQAVR